MTSKIAIKAQHLQTAYSAILQANQLKAEFAFMQSAKLYHTNDHLHRALQEIEQGLKLLGALDTNSTNRPSYDPTMMKKLAKATVRSARWMQETGRFEHLEIVNRYHRAVKLCPEFVFGIPPLILQGLPLTLTLHQMGSRLLSLRSVCR